ncbi:unnamed protein product [Caenorhabditis angaria]|uniref:Protein inscuteable homologue C-terminal domain-containing protein n=1 Tax=Caenorhabditis angaria TaxID=860376 RepID=A0A9P1IBJ1_9PELO|nr:unnamed protein product [Caenorhabditis angaria]
MSRLARFWDSLENDNFFDIVACPPKHSLTKYNQQWLSSLQFSRDDELSTILYAKPLYGIDKLRHYYGDEKMKDDGKDNYYSTKKISIGNNTNKNNMISTSLGNLSAPPKPQRRIARMRSSANDFAASLPQLLEHTTTLDMIRNTSESNSTLCSNGYRDDPSIEDARVRNIKLPGFRGDLKKSLSKYQSHPSVVVVAPNRPPPSYEQFQVMRKNSIKSGNATPIKRHTVTVNGEHVQQALTRMESSNESTNTILRSPKSNRSDSITSVDSGQCSSDQPEKRSLCSFRQESKDEDENGMPSYARMASTMDHVLRTSSALFTLLSTTLDPTISRDILAKSSVFLQLLETSPCQNVLPKNEISQLKLNVAELQKNRETGQIDMNNMTNFFAILLRKTIESVLQIFVRIICKYMQDCNSKDRLLSISLEHLIHICLFGDELCIEAIQKNCITYTIRLLKCPGNPENTNRFLLRTLAVLCGVSKGSLALLTQGGLELVIDRLLSKSSSVCSIEAAGILTQLTNPQSAFIRLNHVQPIISRLLDLIDQCTTGDSLLLASAALNNVTLQHPSGVDIMYKNSAIRRFINAHNRENCATIFVQEQIVTAFSRLASRHYERQLVEQKAVPVLLEFLSLTHPIHADYCRRIRYKAAVCIGTLANSEIGLKSLYDNNAYAILSNVLYDDNNVSNPFNMICNNIRNRLESKYQSESAV